MNSPGRPLRILLVEDSRDDADLILLALDEGGFDVASARVETEGGMREALLSAKWDVVISDFNLPRFDTRSALAVLRETDAAIPFIIVSGCIGEESAVALMKEGASDFVMKDKLARLVPAIERELRDAELRREHHRAQEALRTNEKLLREITSTLGEGIYVLNDRRELVFMNPEAERLLGWTERELAGRNMHEFIHACRPDGSFLPEAECGALGVLRDGGIYRSDDDVFRRKDGSTIPVSIVSSAIMEHGRPVASVTAFQDISRRKQAERELLESRSQLRELSAHLQSVREEERTRIAREMHDELGQMMTAVKLDASWLINQLPDQGAAVMKKADAMSARIDDTLNAMRRIAADLRPVMLDDLGLSAAIEWLTEEFTERTGIKAELVMGRAQCKEPCEWECSLQWDDNIGGETATAAFRIVQECLTNVARHAQAAQVFVSLQCRDGNLVLQVVDDGCGLPTRAMIGRDSYGVIGMRERAWGLGGRLSLSSEPGKGTRVEAIIPIRVPEFEGGEQ